MITIRHPRRVALFAAGLLVTGAFAVLGSAPALAYTQIYGSGAALQTLLQNEILIKKSGQVGGFVQFDTTTSGKGYDEFGDQGSVGHLKLEDSLSGGELDAYVATDSGPTVTELEYAREAATGSKTSTSENEVAVPVAQTPLDLLLSLPAGLTLYSTQTIDLTDLLAGQLYAGTVPQSANYAQDTWGALLEDVGLTRTASSSTPPTSVGQFEDSGGGTATISVVVRKEGAGTTVNLKQFLPLVDPTDWGSINVDAITFNGTKEWPTTATEIPSGGTGNDQEEVTYVDGTPGSVGYATAGDANTNPVLPIGAATFKSTPTKSLDPPKATGAPASAEHQILYALLQDNDSGVSGSRTPPIYADPEVNSTGTANIYTGANVKVNGSVAGGAGNWQVPTADGTFNPDGTWSPVIDGTVTNTRASDPDIYDDSGDSVAYYPLVAVAFDLSWSNFAAVDVASISAQPYTSEAQATTKAFLQFATSSIGQSDILGQSFYSPLPSDVGSSSLANIDAVAQSAAGGV